ncbi:hypothetical protein [Deinococcus puniceus]|uniref:Uncharacterized protein n=1 Tax=Deinococcus puniceus TaxID=1182568 RepID=A0A172TBT4_9DEIO|nr:hypothetical protein [Deinococcus puniceus]ANE44488.1 hypothetical protein SU48_12760 [Deinococcus puniceus]
MRKFPLAALLMCGFALAQVDQEEQRTMNRLSLEARQFTGMKCDFVDGTSSIGSMGTDIGYAQKHLAENYQYLWNSLDPKTRKVTKQVKSVSQISDSFYIRDKYESYFSHSWYDSKTKLFYQNFCALQMLK